MHVAPRPHLDGAGDPAAGSGFVGSPPAGTRSPGARPTGVGATSARSAGTRPTAARARSSELPDVRAVVGAHADPIARNEAINASYQQLALGIQRVIGRAPGTYPNWFAVGVFASPQVGRSMVAAHQTERAVEMLRGGAGGASREEIFDAIGLRGGARRLASTIAATLEVAGSPDGATAIASFVAIMLATDRATATSALFDPRLASAVAYRLNQLLRPEIGILGGLKSMLGIDSSAKDRVLDNMSKLCRTYVSLLEEGNRAIFLDIGGSAAEFLKFRENRGAPSPDEILRDLHLPESSAAGSRRVFEHALQHAFDRAPPTHFAEFAPPGRGNDLVRAAFALYTLAGKTPDLDRKNALVAHANNLIAWREQFETVQPVFTDTRPDELERGRVLAALTPLVQVPFSTFTWKFSTFARRQPSRDHNPLTARTSEYDWSKFTDRWPAILDAFTAAYRKSDDIFRFPNPSVR